MKRGWEISIDTGGTFTDALGRDPEGRIHRAKVLSTGALRGTVIGVTGARTIEIRTAWSLPPSLLRGCRFRLLSQESKERVIAGYDPGVATIELAEPLETPIPDGAAFEIVSGEDAATLATRILTGTPPGADLPVEWVRLGTTLGTNALLTRRGAATALLVTKGFRDLLLIGAQDRPDLFALDVRKPEPLPVAVLEIAGRLAHDGEELVPLDPPRIAEAARALRARGIESAAIALLHAYRNPAHEIEVERILREEGFPHVTRSSEIAPVQKVLLRAETAVVDAYLAPIVGEYLDRVRAPLGAGALRVMTSAGGLVAREAYRPKDSLLSGPAGGVVGAVLAGRRSGLTRILSFDMGGTSTDVCRFDGDFEYVFEHGVGGARLAAPALAVETVAAGGGSICWFDGDRLRVGPASASADPGPACYGAGGPLTITDVNLLLGRLDPGSFEIPISVSAAREALEALLLSVRERERREIEAGEVLRGCLEIANERMAEAIRQVSVRSGYDPSEYAIVAFGGAGGQHACAVAERLGIRRVLVPPDAGILSAFGLGRAVVERFAERQVLLPLDRARDEVSGWIESLARQAIAALEGEGVSPAEIEVRRRIVDLRLVGQETVLAIAWSGDARSLEESFRERYEALFGYAPETLPLELVTLRVVASSRPDGAEAAGPVQAAIATPAGHRDVPVYSRDTLAPGARFSSPALVIERHGATVVEPGWSAEVDGAMGLLMTRTDAPLSGDGSDLEALETVQLELFTSRFRAIATEMGERLRRTAVSTNVKERLDFSCAVLDEEGMLVVNAPHIPVHLGALGLCVRSLAETMEMLPGDVVVTNHPAFGGSHLPDVTVVSPVFSSDTPAALLGYVASRAHHAELGGSRPGSMPPHASRLIEEGVVLAPAYLVRKGVPRWEEIARALAAPPFPSRALSDNLADLRAAVAANRYGAQALAALAAASGRDTVRRYMRALQDLAARRITEALAALPAGEYEAVETLDDGSALRARIDLRAGKAVIDFSGSAAAHPGNLNATPAIVRSVVLYVLRLLVRTPLPLNEGLLRPVELRVPRGSILNPVFAADPAECPAVVGGNVETSQRLVDTLLKALGIAACSQGTMNNVVFGTDRFTYYETVCGGAGAGPGFDGASAVHTHMTNTRITDPEVLEHRYPVRLERFEIREGSGGGGAFRGGDGVVREIAFLAPMSLSILSQHRTSGPYGLDGGRPGVPGAQRILRASGDVTTLSSIDSSEVAAGDRLILETPGGGGYGRPDRARDRRSVESRGAGEPS